MRAERYLIGDRVYHITHAHGHTLCHNRFKSWRTSQEQRTRTQNGPRHSGPSYTLQRTNDTTTAEYFSTTKSYATLLRHKLISHQNLSALCSLDRGRTARVELPSASQQLKSSIKAESKAPSKGEDFDRGNDEKSRQYFMMIRGIITVICYARTEPARAISCTSYTIKRRRGTILNNESCHYVRVRMQLQHDFYAYLWSGLPHQWHTYIHP